MTALDWYGRRATRYVRPVERAQAQGLVAKVYEQAGREFVLAPPLTLYSPVPELLASVWACLREALVVGPDRLRKEAVAREVSVLNQCPYCVDVHSVMLGGARGVATNVSSSAPFLGTALTFHFINRMVNVFLYDSPMARLPGWARGTASAIASRTFGQRMISVQAAPGESLVLLPKREASTGIPIVDDHPFIGPALSALFSTSRNGAADLLSCAGRAVVEQAVSQSVDPGETLSVFSEHDLPAARLALLTALASYKVSEEDVAAFRVRHPSDDALIRITAYGAGMAARRVGSGNSLAIRL